MNDTGCFRIEKLLNMVSTIGNVNVSVVLLVRLLFLMNVIAEAIIGGSFSGALGFVEEFIL